MFASSLPPPAPLATSTHLMFQPVCVPPALPHVPLAVGVAFLMPRVVPPYCASAYPIWASPALWAAM